MSYFELFGLVTSAVGIAYGFGRQAASISTLKKDVNEIARMHRETIDQLSSMNMQLARIDQRLLSLER